MISKLLVLGNGFDLHCGLESSFSSYFKKNCLSKVQLFYKAFSCAQFEDARRHCQKYPDVINFWSFLFYINYYEESEYKINNNKNQNWFDIEDLIKAALLTKKIPDFETLEDCIEAGFKALKKGNNARVNGNELIRKNPYAFFPFSQETDATDPYEYLLNELHAFENNFQRYMMDVSFTNADYVGECINLFHDIVGESQKVNLINFNYTSIREFCSNNIYGETNVHGDLDGDDIIIGIDSGSANSNNLIKFTKTYRNINRLRERFSIPSPGEIDGIVFYGHSLAEADFSYFHSLFDTYNLYNGNLTLTFCYSDYCETEKENEAKHAEYTKKVYNLIKKYSETSHKDSNLLHRLILEGRILVKKIPH